MGHTEPSLPPLPVVAVVAALVVAMTLTGCVSVSPDPDYQQARDRIARSTGQPVPYSPDVETLVASHVEGLVKAGLTVDTAVQVCLLNNRELQSSWLDIGIARADLVQAGLLSNPTFDFALRLPASGGLPDLTADLAQNIAELWQIPARKRAAGHALNQAILQVARRAAELAADAKSAYFHAVGAQSALENAQANLAIAQRSLDLALVRQRAGAGTEVEVNLARGPVLDAELALRAARLEAGEARRALARLLGLTDQADSLVLVDSLPILSPRALDAEALLDLARQERLDLQAATHAVNAAAARVQQQWRAVFPTVQIGVAMERNQQQTQPRRHILADTARATVAKGQLNAPDIQPSSDRRRIRRTERNLDMITGPSLSLQIPVFDQNQAQIAKAVFAYRQAVKTYDGLDQTLVQDVRSAVARAATAWDIAQFYRERSLPLAERNLDLSRESLKAGKASLLEILELQRFLLDVRNRYTQAAQDAASRIADLERAVGLPMRDWMPAASTGPASQPASAPAASMPF